MNLSKGLTRVEAREGWCRSHLHCAAIGDVARPSTREGGRCLGRAGVVKGVWSDHLDCRRGAGSDSSFPPLPPPGPRSPAIFPLSLPTGSPMETAAPAPPGPTAAPFPPLFPPGLHGIYGECRRLYPEQPNPLQVTAILKYW